MALPAIELQNVTIQIGELPILKNISFKVQEQESLVLIGPSGQGKTILLKTMAGLILPNEGRVFIRGESLEGASVARRHELQKKMGMLFQKNALFDSMTNAENISFPLRESGKYDEHEIPEIVDKFLEAVGILHARNLFPDEISGGMQKRLGIARALALRPEIVFYDDPTAGLDPITSRKIIELILSLKAKNKSTIVAITNDMNRAFQLADKIAMIVDQDVIQTGNKEETKENKDPRVSQFVNGNLQGPLLRFE